MNTLDFNIESYTAELCYSRKSGDEMVKLRLYDENVCEIYALYLMMNHTGYAKERSHQILITMFKDIKDYLELKINDRLCIDILLDLFNDPGCKQMYFKEFSKVTLSTTGHHVRLVEWTFK